MPEVSNGTILLGLALGFGLSVLVKRRTGRQLFVPLAMALGIGMALSLPYVRPTTSAVWASLGLPPLTAGAVFIGVWATALVLTFVVKKHHSWARVFVLGVSVFLLTAYALPPLIDQATGRYQAASLRPDVNACTDGMLGQVQPRTITNICDMPIIVGLCLPDEVNPQPCVQTHLIAPGETSTFDPGEARLSSVPGNPGGLTVVACRPPARPSRWGNVTGRGYRGVCLPPV